MPINREILASAKCANAFRIISWSVMWFCLDFHIPIGRDLKIDLTPDLVGWLITALALSRITELSPRLNNMRKLVSWLMGLSLFQIVQSETSIENLGILILWIRPILLIGVWGTALFTIVTQVLTTILVSQFCSLIADMAIAAQDNKLQRKAALCKKVYIALIVAYFFPLPFFPLFSAMLSQLVFVTLPNMLIDVLRAAGPASLLFVPIVVLLAVGLIVPIILIILLIEDAVKMCRRYAILH